MRNKSAIDKDVTDRAVAAFAGVHAAVESFGSEKIKQQVHRSFSLLQESVSKFGEVCCQTDEVELCHILFVLPEASKEGVLSFAVKSQVRLATVKNWATQGLLVVADGQIKKRAHHSLDLDRPPTLN